MSCCGDRRREFQAPSPAYRPSGPPSQDRRSFRSSVAWFEYTGQTSMVVVGPVSGKRYVFDRPGARVGVDPVDKPSLASVPRLRVVLGLA